MMAKSLSTNQEAFGSSVVYSARPPFPPRLLLEATNACNHRCLFCSHSVAHRPPAYLDVALAERCLHEAFALGARECSFHGGGEAFLHPQLPELVRLAKDIGYTYVYTTTNGAACSWARMLAVLEAGLDSIKFSINAGCAEDYAAIHGRDDFAKVIARIRAVHAWRESSGRSLPIYVSSIVCAQSTARMGELAAQIGPYVDEHVILPAVWLGRPTRMPITELVPAFEPQALCSEPFARLSIASDGAARVCCSDGDNHIVIADAAHADLNAIWCSPRFVGLREAMLNHVLPRGTLCANCMHFEDVPLSRPTPGV